MTAQITLHTVSDIMSVGLKGESVEKEKLLLFSIDYSIQYVLLKS